MATRYKEFSNQQQVRLARFLTALLGFGAILIALTFQDIFTIMIFAFSFWGPTLLVPFIFALYNVIFTPKQFLGGVGLSLVIIGVWNLFPAPPFKLESVIPSMLFSTLYYLGLWVRKRMTEGRNE